MEAGDFAWNVRVVPAGPNASRAHARACSFDVGAQASFREADPLPCALEVLLGALGGDLAAGWRGEAGRRGFRLHELELTLSARLGNPLRYLGVIGEAGDIGLAAITGTLYLSSDCPGSELEAAWQAVRERSPLYVTLSRGASVSIALHPVP